MRHFAAEASGTAKCQSGCGECCFCPLNVDSGHRTFPFGRRCPAFCGIVPGGGEPPHLDFGWFRNQFARRSNRIILAEPLPVRPQPDFQTGSWRVAKVRPQARDIGKGLFDIAGLVLHQLNLC